MSETVRIKKVSQAKVSALVSTLGLSKGEILRRAIDCFISRSLSDKERKDVYCFLKRGGG